MNWKQQIKHGLDHWIRLCPNEEKYASIKKQIIELTEDIEDELSIMVVGEFNAGKSTFINALLGQKILSADVVPETAVVTKLTFGKSRKVIAHFLDGHTTVYDDIWFYQLTAEKDGNFKTIRHQLSYVELQLPLEILREFTIIDTPGLNAINEYHTKATERFLGRADFVIFLFHVLHVGTKTEMKWLKKFHKKKIYPFGIINQIDLMEDDELEDLIDFNQANIGPVVKKLAGVSSRDAFNAQIQKDDQLLEWSNWKEVEQLLDNLKAEVDRKMEHTYYRILEPLRQMEKFFIESKLSLPLKKLNLDQVAKFIGKDIPELQSTKERISANQELVKSVSDKWNNFLNTTITTFYQLDVFLRKFMALHLDMLGRNAFSLNFNPLQLWEESVLPDYDRFCEDRKELNDKITKLNEERERLEESWNKIYKSRSLRKKKSLKQLQKRIDLFHHELDRIEWKRGALLNLFKEMNFKVNGFRNSIITIIENDINFYVEQENEDIVNLKKQQEKIEDYFTDLSKSDLTNFELFSIYLEDFQRNVAKPLQDVGKVSERAVIAAYKQADNYIQEIVNIKQELPPEEVYACWRKLEDLTVVNKIKYELISPNFIPIELKHHDLLPLPNKMNHDIQVEINKIHFKQIEWIAGTVSATILSTYIGYLVFMNVENENPVAKEVTNTVADSTSVDHKQQPLQEEPQTPMTNFTKDDIEVFLQSVRQRLNVTQNRTGLFTGYGWLEYQPYYEDTSKGELVNFVVTDIEYGSYEEIKANVKETYKIEGVTKEFESMYMLSNMPSSGNDLMIIGFTYSLANQTEEEIIVENSDFEAFLNNFRNKYMQALNTGNSIYIDDFVEQGSPAHKELLEYIDSIAGKGYTFEHLNFQVNQVMKVENNEYNVSTFEKFIFTDDKNEKTDYERTKDYLVKVLPEKWMIINNITIIDTKRENINIPTVQLVTNQNVNEFIQSYYIAFESAFNGSGFSYVQNYYDPNGSGYHLAESYIINANSKNMRMSNLELNIESVSQADDNHYVVIANIADEYSYQDGTGDRKKIRAHYKVGVTPNGNMMISEDPTIEILEKVEF
ncbi:dynamin family protein [Niallia oryzisoli]|uniref:dynamin family protein n=1 Tax=Niallia oryzisoli TaxID=1737571 RepID=UPI003736C4F4